MGRHPLHGVTLGALLCTACGDGLVAGQPPPGSELVPATMHRLTAAQYQQTVRSLLGEGIAIPSDLEVDTPLHGYTSVGASELTIAPRAAEQYEAAALQLAQAVWSDAPRRQKLLGAGCKPMRADDLCVRGFLATFGLRAWRRPLTADELDQLVGLVDELAGTLGGVMPALEYALAALLQSPHFLFRVEVGEPDPEHPSERRYTAYEMASRLSYLLANTMPDDQLLAAAERGELLTREGVRAQAERLLAMPAARAALLGFFGEYFNLQPLDSATKDKALFPQFTPQLVAAMRKEITSDLEDVLFARGGDYREILSSSSTFVNADLAKLYGVPAPAGEWARIELPESSGRGGLLGTAGVLALNAHATLTSPTHRGKFVREYLLCQDIPPPPPGVVLNLEPQMGMEKTTLRQRLEQHRQNAACRSCHERMDPIGFGLEKFDAIGAARDTDNGLPIDAHADIEGQPFEGPRQLGQLLAGHPRLAECVARQFYRHATGHVEEHSEDPIIQALGQRLQDANFRFQSLVLELVQSDGFRRANPNPDAVAQGEGG